MVAADRNGVEAGSKARAELKSIDHQAHGRPRRIDVFLLRDVFLEDVVLNGAGNFLPIGALLFRHRQVHGPQHRGWRIDGHGDSGLFQIDAGEQYLHVFQRINGHAALAHFAFALHVVAVVAHERRQIEGNGQSAAAVSQQILVALVRFFRRSEAGELAHGPQLAAIAGGMNAAGERRLAGVA